MKRLLAIAALLALAASPSGQTIGRHTFALGATDFLLDGKPLRIISGEMHPARIPAEYRKGVVWVNGHNLGRYWDVGPQTRLYCPAPWLKTGENEVIVFDLHKTEASPLRGVATRD